MPKPAKKNIRMGQPPKYDFGTIRARGRKFIATDKPKNVQNAAYNYAKHHGIVLKARATDDGAGVEVRRVDHLKKK